MVREASGTPQIKNVFKKLNIQRPSNWLLHSYTINEYSMLFSNELNVWALGGSL